jgi:hypothetical protein
MKGSSLIREIDPAGEVVSEPAVALTPAPPAKAAPEPVKPVRESVQDDQPSILEMMMAAQREANAEKAKEKAVEAEVESKKPIGNGFKKGFFGGSAKPKATTTTAAKKADAEVIEVKKAPPAAKAASPYVFDDVQRAMEEDQHPLLKQLKQKGKNERAVCVWHMLSWAEHASPCARCALAPRLDWITPDLTKAFQSNQVLSRGFSDPKCMAAMQLLQTDPKEAQRRFQNDPEVSGFLQEFGRLMAGHFEALGSAQGQQGQQGQQGSGAAAGGGGVSSAPSSSSSSGGGGDGIRIGSASSSGAGSAPVIQELGPLHAQALQRKKYASKCLDFLSIPITHPHHHVCFLSHSAVRAQAARRWSPPPHRRLALQRQVRPALVVPARRTRRRRSRR